MGRSLVPAILTILLIGCSSNADLPAAPIAGKARELARKHTVSGADEQEAALVAEALLEYYTAGDFVVRGTVTAVDRRWTKRGEPRERIMITLELASVLSGGFALSSPKLRVQTWNHLETGAAQLKPGDMVIVGLVGKNGDQPSYALAHPRAIVMVDENILRIPRLELQPTDFVESLDRLGARASRGAQ